MATLTPPSADLKTALAALERALMAVGVWADTRRQAAERRLGVGPTDPRAWEDPECAAALDWVGLVSSLRDHARDVVARLPEES